MSGAMISPASSAARAVQRRGGDPNARYGVRIEPETGPFGSVTFFDSLAEADITQFTVAGYIYVTKDSTVSLPYHVFSDSNMGLYVGMAGDSGEPTDSFSVPSGVPFVYFAGTAPVSASGAAWWPVILYDFPTTGWRHIIVSVDFGTGTVQCAIDGQYIGHLRPENTTPIGATGYPQNAAEREANTVFPTETMTPQAVAEIWFDDTYFDLSDPENIARFILPNGKPADLGFSGELPTTTTPALYMTLRGKNSLAEWFLTDARGRAIPDITDAVAVTGTATNTGGSGVKAKAGSSFKLMLTSGVSAAMETMTTQDYSENGVNPDFYAGRDIGGTTEGYFVLTDNGEGGFTLLECAITSVPGSVMQAAGYTTLVYTADDPLPVLDSYDSFGHSLFFEWPDLLLSVYLPDGVLQGGKASGQYFTVAPDGESSEQRPTAGEREGYSRIWLNAADTPDVSTAEGRIHRV